MHKGECSTLASGLLQSPVRCPLIFCHGILTFHSSPLTLLLSDLSLSLYLTISPFILLHFLLLPRSILFLSWLLIPFFSTSSLVAHFSLSNYPLHHCLATSSSNLSFFWAYATLASLRRMRTMIILIFFFTDRRGVEVAERGDSFSWNSDRQLPWLWWSCRDRFQWCKWQLQPPCQQKSVQVTLGGRRQNFKNFTVVAETLISQPGYQCRQTPVGWR